MLARLRSARPLRRPLLVMMASTSAHLKRRPSRHRMARHRRLVHLARLWRRRVRRNRRKKQKTDAQKSVDGNFVKAKGLKTRLDTVQSKYLTLKEAVDTDAGWDWAKSRSLQDPIARARAKVEAVKKISAFWKEWSISSSVQFASAVKKSSTPKQM